VVPISAALRQGPHFKVCSGGESLATCVDLIGSGFEPHTSRTSKVAAVASLRQRVVDLIGSGFEPHTSRTRSEQLITCTIWPVVKEQLGFSFSFVIFCFCCFSQEGSDVALRLSNQEASCQPTL